MSEFTEEDKQLIEERYRELLSVSKLSQRPEQLEMIERAFHLAKNAHGNMRRKSGEPYILHPIEVARICTHEIGLGTKAIVASLLHDVVEDTDYTIEDIEHQFGTIISNIVDGLTKISGVFENRSDMQVENFRKILMTMTDDLRVILIKLADRLHNMRTLESMPANKQLKISSETLFIYSPLAHRLGLYAIKSELEDLSLKYQHPVEYQMITEKITESEKKRITYINRFALPITQRLTQLGYEFEISGRPKSVYSIWNKMKNKNISYEEIYDLFAIRIVFTPKPGIPEKSQCWDIYSTVTDLYIPRSDRIRDWISKPKANGYEALHATVMGPNGKWVEVQVRSERMNEIAEKGYAAHWKYKNNQNAETELDLWIKQVRQMLEDPKADAYEFLDDFKVNLFTREIMVFSPKGEIVTMPADSTALDFAFFIHSEIGFHAIGAKVNNRLVPLSYTLKGGDQVEILTSDKQEPNSEWMQIVTTAKAKTKLKGIFKEQRKVVSKEGKEHLDELLIKLDLKPNSYTFRKLYSHYLTRNKAELYYQIGLYKPTAKDLKKIIDKRSKRKWIKFWSLASGPVIQPSGNGTFDKNKTLQLDDTTENFLIATCCHPLPGDYVIGHRESDDDITIHKATCSEAIRLNSSESQNVVKVEWRSQRVLAFLGRISIKGIDQVGMLSKLTKVISDELSVNIRSINFESRDGMFSGTLDIYIHDSNDLNNLLLNLGKIKGINSVVRVEISDEAAKE